MPIEITGDAKGKINAAISIHVFCTCLSSGRCAFNKNANAAKIMQDKHSFYLH